MKIKTNLCGTRELRLTFVTACSDADYTDKSNGRRLILGTSQEGIYEGYGMPSRDQGFRIDVCTVFGIGIVTACSDTDDADESNDRRSVSGILVTLRGAAVSWVSGTERCVTLSKTEAEHVPLGE